MSTPSPRHFCHRDTAKSKTPLHLLPKQKFCHFCFWSCSNHVYCWLHGHSLTPLLHYFQTIACQNISPIFQPSSVSSVPFRLSSSAPELSLTWGDISSASCGLFYQNESSFHYTGFRVGSLSSRQKDKKINTAYESISNIAWKITTPTSHPIPRACLRPALQAAAGMQVVSEVPHEKRQHVIAAVTPTMTSWHSDASTRGVTHDSNAAVSFPFGCARNPGRAARRPWNRHV